MKKSIPYGCQTVLEDDIKIVCQVLQSDFLTQGPMVPKFEENLACYVGAKYAIAVNSATSALHLACLALGVRPGDYVWTTPISFVASANCALYCGAKVDFVDIDPNTYTISIIELEKKLILAEKSNRLPKVVIPVHLAGLSCDMEAIYKLSKKYGFSVIEDASHAIGGKYQGGMIGNCQYSDIVVFSFHPVKIITTGEGGAVLTNNKKLAQQIFLLRSHGVTRSNDEMSHVPDGPWYYEQIALGFNYRMTDLQAALGISQLAKINDFVNSRVEIASYYNQNLLGLPLKLPTGFVDRQSSWHLYIVYLEDDVAYRHLEIFNYLHSQQIKVGLHYIPIYSQPYYKKLGFERENYPESEKYYARAISLPIFPKLSRANQNYIIEHVKFFFK